MSSTEERYKAATAYVRRAVEIVEALPIAYHADAVTGAIEWYAGKQKTAPARDELARLEARWLRASTDDERTKIARDAELLADRVEEGLPGAPQDRQRTNLFKGETPKGTPMTSYADEVDRQAALEWGWIKSKAEAIADEASTIGKWLLIGGGLLLGFKAIDLVSDYKRRRTSGQTEQRLNSNLESAAEQRDARRRSAGYYVRRAGTQLYYRVVQDNGGRFVLLIPLTDEALDAVADRESFTLTMPDGTAGEAFSDDIARYERVERLPKSVLS
jgi:hypothetical protein